MMNGQQQPARRLVAGIEPDRLQHHSGCGCKTARRGVRLLTDAGSLRSLIKPADIDAEQAVGSGHCAGQCHLQAPLRACVQPQSQRVVMINEACRAATR
jgi:hypothetical protein